MSERTQEGPPTKDEAAAYSSLLRAQPSLDGSRMPGTRLWTVINKVHDQDDLWLLRKDMNNDVRVVVCSKLTDPDRLHSMSQPDSQG